MRLDMYTWLGGINGLGLGLATERLQTVPFPVIPLLVTLGKWFTHSHTSISVATRHHVLTSVWSLGSVVVRASDS